MLLVRVMGVSGSRSDGSAKRKIAFCRTTYADSDERFVVSWLVPTSRVRRSGIAYAWNRVNTHLGDIGASTLCIEYDTCYSL